MTVSRVVDKLLHAPTVRVKQLAGGPGGDSYAAALRELFELDPERRGGGVRPRRGRAGVTASGADQAWCTRRHRCGWAPGAPAGHVPGQDRCRRDRRADRSPVELVEIVTQGDRSRPPWPSSAAPGVFVSALRDALRAGRNRPGRALPEGPAHGARRRCRARGGAGPRGPARRLVLPAGWTLGELRPGTLVGTGSPRRAAQLRALGQELDVVTIRGNVDTRLRKVEAGEVDAVVLARAGLARIDRLDAVTEMIDPCRCCPPPGRAPWRWNAGRPTTRSSPARRALDHAGTRAAVAAERAFLAAVEAGCTAPVGALAEVAEDELYLRGVIASLDGSDVFRQSVTGPITDPGRSAAGSPGKCSSREPPMCWRLRLPGVRHVDGRATTVTKIPLSSSDSPAAPAGGAAVPAPSAAPCAVAQDRARAEVVLLGAARACRPATVRGRGLLARADVVVVDPGRRPGPQRPSRWPPRCRGARARRRDRARCAQRAAGGALVVRSSPATRCPRTRCGRGHAAGRRQVSRSTSCRACRWRPASRLRGGSGRHPLLRRDVDRDARSTGPTRRHHARAPRRCSERPRVPPRQDRRRAAGAGPAGRHPGQRHRGRHRRLPEDRRDHATRSAPRSPACGWRGPPVVAVGGAPVRATVLSWWETRPLYGWKVLVPRTKEQAGAMSDRLRAYGALPVEVPTIAVEPPRTPAQMERAIKGLVTGRYEWIVFTSINAVSAMRDKFDEFGLDARAFAGVKIACVGESTADAVRAFGIQPELCPRRAVLGGPAADFPPYDEVLDPIDRVLLPRADIATETLAAGLQERGWEIDDVTAYRTVRAAPPPAEIRDAIKSGGFDAVLLHLVLDRAQPGRHRRQAARAHGLVAIGPQHRGDGRRVRAAAGRGARARPSTALVDALAAFAVAWRARERRRRRNPARAAGPPRGDRRVPRRPAAPAAAGRAAAPARLGRAAAPGRPDPAAVRQGGHRPSRRRCRPCRASCSTPSTRWARPRTRPSRPASAG